MNQPAAETAAALRRLAARLRAAPAWLRIVLLLAAVAALAACLIPPPQTVFAVSARTEALSLTVKSPPAASFGLRRARLVRDDGANECLSDVSVAPDYDAVVQYARFGAGPLTITLDAARLSSAAASPPASPPAWAGRVQPPVQLVLDPDDRDCPSPAVVRLPLSGVIDSIGDDVGFSDDPRSPRLVLISGAVRLLVRAIEWRAGDAPARARSEMFAADELQLPPGSVLRDGRAADGSPADWWGFVDVVFSDATQRGFEAEASSHASSVSIDLPAAVRGDDAGSLRELSIDFVQRWARDPTLRLLALLWAAATLLAAIGRWMHARLSAGPAPR